MIDRRCNQCDRPYQARRSTSKYCTEKCRNDAKTKPAATTLRVAAAGPVGGRVAEMVERELAKVQRVETVAGQAALVLARRLDTGYLDTGSGLTALAKQLESTMATALAGAPKAPDFIDELEQRRLAKFGA